MIRLSDDEVLARTPDDIPDGARGRKNEHIESSLGQPFSTLFPEFAPALPKTSASIEQHWAPMALVYWRDDYDGGWFCDAILESQDDRPNLVVGTYPKSTRPYRDRFEDSTGMLPPRWRELYRWFNAFGLEAPRVRNARITSILPTAYEGRKNIENFVVLINDNYPNQYNVTEQRINQSFNDIAAANPHPSGNPGDLFCWCFTDQAESLWACQQDMSGTIYHVRGDQFDRLTPLVDPDDKLDHYMMLILENGNSEGFDFRS